MAVAYQSIASAAWANSSTTVISKPSGTVDGDLLVAVLVGSRNGGTNPAMSSAPSGWTLFHSTTVDSSTGIMLSYYKVASSEPTSWTWTWTSSAPDFAGAVVRVNGHAAPGTLAPVTDDGTTADSASATFTGGVTPAATDSLLLFLAFSKDAGNSHSAQAITTSNPSWTEVLDSKSGLGTNAIFSVAYASRPEVTATGNFTMTIDSGSAATDSIGHLIAIPARTDVTVSPGVQSVVSSVNDVTVTGGATASPAVISVVASVQAPTVSMPTPDWTNENKNIAICINQDKS